VYLLTSQQQLSQESQHFVESEGLNVLYLKNQGFDFGLWYQAFQKLDVTSYDRLALVNDSCILFRSLDDFAQWMENDKADIKGMTRSEAIFPHLQSYFLVLNKRTIPTTLTYFNEHKILPTISEVIQTYEVGLNKFWRDQGFSISAYIGNNGYSGEYSPYYFCVEEHLKNGMPLIKKKILYSSYREEELFTLARMNFKIDPAYYLAILLKEPKLLIDPVKLAPDLGKDLTMLQRLKYNTTRMAIQWFRPLVKTLKRN
jgi:lipopolysaccharide biosynthesis protein